MGNFKKKEIQEKEKLRNDVKVLHNGFRESVYKELTAINKKLENKKCSKCGIYEVLHFGFWF